MSCLLMRVCWSALLERAGRASIESGASIDHRPWVEKEGKSPSTDATACLIYRGD
jgi:hypothetical protein